MEAAIDRIMQTYDLLANRTAAASAEAREKVTNYLNILMEAGETDTHRLTVCGLTYLRQLDGSVDPVIWIESIPFTETRNYVMRVMESLHVYRARLRGRPEALRLLADIGASPVVHVSTRDLGPAAADAAGLAD